MTIAQAKGGSDYYTRLWNDMKDRRGRKSEFLVNVRIAKDSAMLGQGFVLKVQVYSQVLKGRIKQAEKQMTKADGMDGLRRMAGLMAAALSEECCNEYGDSFNPSDYERMGKDAFDQLVQKLQDGELTIGLVNG